MTRREMPLVCDGTMTLSLRPSRRPHLLQGQMLFLLGQRAAKIALHDSQDRALVVGQTQPLGFAPRPYDPTGLALDGPVRRLDHFRAHLGACLLHLRLGQARQQPHAAQVRS